MTDAEIRKQLADEIDARRQMDRLKAAHNQHELVDVTSLSDWARMHAFREEMKPRFVVGRNAHGRTTVTDLVTGMDMGRFIVEAEIKITVDGVEAIFHMGPGSVALADYDAQQGPNSSSSERTHDRPASPL